MLRTDPAFNKVIKQKILFHKVLLGWDVLFLSQRTKRNEKQPHLIRTTRMVMVNWLYGCHILLKNFFIGLKQPILPIVRNESILLF